VYVYTWIIIYQNWYIKRIQDCEQEWMHKWISLALPHFTLPQNLFQIQYILSYQSIWTGSIEGNSKTKNKTMTTRGSGNIRSLWRYKLSTFHMFASSMGYIGNMQPSLFTTIWCVRSTSPWKLVEKNNCMFQVYNKCIFNLTMSYFRNKTKRKLWGIQKILLQERCSQLQFIL
jgi:hypothetical protein